MTVQRILASAALVAALAGAALVLLGGRGAGAEYELHFTHAGLLVEGADVLIGGRRAGQGLAGRAHRRRARRR